MSTAYSLPRHTFSIGIRLHRILAYVFPWAFSAYVVTVYWHTFSLGRFRHTSSAKSIQGVYSATNGSIHWTITQRRTQQTVKGVNRVYSLKKKYIPIFHKVYTPFGENINLPSVTGVYPKLLQGIHFSKKRIYAFVCRIPFRNILSRGKSILGWQRGIRMTSKTHLKSICQVASKGYTPTTNQSKRVYSWTQKNILFSFWSRVYPEIPPGTWVRDRCDTKISSIPEP